MQPDQRLAASSDELSRADMFRGANRGRESGREAQSIARRRTVYGIVGSLGLVFLAGGLLTVQADDSNPKVAKGKKQTEKPKSPAADSDPDSKTVDDNVAKKDEGSDPKPKIIKTDAEWKKILKPEQFRVTRLKETELPFTNKFWDNKKHGKYFCICCGEELYPSDREKFDSGTGWPSFCSSVSEKAIGTDIDYSALP